MAEKKTEAEVNVTKADVFEAKDIAQNAPSLYGYSTDIATAAFQTAGVKRCTLEEAKKIIKTFAERKVK